MDAGMNELLNEQIMMHAEMGVLNIDVTDEPTVGRTANEKLYRRYRRWRHTVPIFFARVGSDIGGHDQSLPAHLVPTKDTWLSGRRHSQFLVIVGRRPSIRRHRPSLRARRV